MFKFPYLYIHGMGAYFDTWTKYTSGVAPAALSGNTAYMDAAATSQVFDYVAISIGGGTTYRYGLGTYTVGARTLTVAQGGSGSAGTTTITLN
ncbi:hypothetical protein HYN49_01465 [Flavobacterium pallidum]|uniref:Uncharacterized protein n=2 Tax=Flavobacterium pallidum TaxID=2172098 RepID=A0A2S1SE69_9FLAO|nr:hypothetical protein HYN49_01465 [Flavobacterium pallidum]